MYLSDIDWNFILPHIKAAAKLACRSTVRKNLQNLKNLECRFNKIKEYFTTKQFNLDNFNQFVLDLQEKGYKNEYVNKLIGTSKHIEKCLFTKKLLKEMVLQDYTLFPGDEHKYEIMTTDDMVRIENLHLDYGGKDQPLGNTTLRNHISYCIYRLLRETGARTCEVTALEQEDVIDCEVTFRKTKNGTTRTVPITKTLYSAIKSIPVKSNYIFYTLRNDNIAEATLKDDFKRRVKILGIKKKKDNDIVYPSLHRYRNSVSTLLLESGIDLADVCEIMGWKNPNMALRYNQIRIAKLRKKLETKYDPFRENETFEENVEKIKNSISERLNVRVTMLHLQQTANALVISLIRK